MATQTPNPTSQSHESRQEYQEKINAQLNRLNAKIDEFEAKAKQAQSEASVEYHNTLEELYAKRDAAKLKLDELSNASEDAWSELRSGFESAWQNLTESVNKAVKKFE